MPLVTLTWRKGKSAEFKTAVLDAVHRALAAASGVPEKDPVPPGAELGPEDFRFDATYPDLTTPRTDEFDLIEILLSVGRSVKMRADSSTCDRRSSRRSNGAGLAAPVPPAPRGSGQRS